MIGSEGGTRMGHKRCSVMFMRLLTKAELEGVLPLRLDQPNGIPAYTNSTNKLTPIADGRLVNALAQWKRFHQKCSRSG